MKEEALSSIFVIGEDRTLYGIVTVDRAVEAVKDKVTDLKKLWRLIFP